MDIMKDSTPIKNSLFLRIFIMFLIIVTPIFAIGLGIYNWGENAISNEIEGSIQSQNDYFLSGLEKEFHQIAMLQYRILNDRVLNELALSNFLINDYDESMDIIDIQEKINTIKISSKFIKDIRVHIPAIKKTITATSSYDMDAAAISLVNAYPAMPDKQFTMWEKKFLLISEYPERQINDKEMPFIFIETEFSAIELKNMLEELNVYDKSDSFMYYEKLNLFIGNDSNRDLCEQIIKVVAARTEPSNNDITVLKPHTKGSGAFFTLISREDYLVIYSISEYMGLLLVRYVPKNILYSKIQQYRLFFWFFTLMVIIIIPIFSAAAYKYIHRPLSRLVKAFARLEKGEMNVEIIDSKQHDEFRYIYEHFNKMAKNLNSLIDQLFRQKIMVQKAELKQLQSQINPHFLYNSFFILKRKIKLADNEEAMRFAQQMGSYFQYITRSADDEVPLVKEAGHAKTFAEIQEMRFSNRITVDIEEVPELHKNLSVPRIILQPLVENAFVHGLENKEKDGRITMGFKSGNNLLSIIIEDNGDCMSDTDLEQMQKSLEVLDDHIEATGMVNVHRRLKLKFGGSSGITLCRGESGGLKVTVNIEHKFD